MDPEELKRDELSIVEKAAQSLGEHFETVQIFVTRYTPGDKPEDGTININYGVGNWFTRYGQVREWFVKVEERTRQTVRAERED